MPMTKKTLFAAILAVLTLLLGACAEKKKSQIKIVRVPVAPGMTAADIKAAEDEAVRELASSERTAQLAALQARAKERFALSCPMGGEADVIIHPALANEYNFWRRGGVSGVLLRRYVMVHRANNPYTNLTLNITNGGQRVVSNLCPGGSITLVQSMPPFTGGDYLRVTWTAEGRVNGRLAYADSSPGTLYHGWYNSEAEARRPTWVINLDRVDRQF